MKRVKVFQRIPEPKGISDDIQPWMDRMEQLILSDPRELLDFASDALIAVAAQLQDDEPEKAWDKTLTILDEATKTPERNIVINMVRKRLQQIQAIATERTGENTALVMQAFYRNARRAPWPDGH